MIEICSQFGTQKRSYSKKIGRRGWKAASAIFPRENVFKESTMSTAK